MNKKNEMLLQSFSIKTTTEEKGTFKKKKRENMVHERCVHGNVIWRTLFLRCNFIFINNCESYLLWATLTLYCVGVININK